MAVCQNLVPLVNIKIAGKWMFIPLKMVCIGIDPYPHHVLSALAKQRAKPPRGKRWADPAASVHWAPCHRAAAETWYLPWHDGGLGE